MKHNNKKLIKETLYDIAILSIISIICILLIHIGLKALLHINTKTITETSKAVITAKHNVTYMSIIIISMFIFSFIVYTMTTINQVKSKMINKDNYKMFELCMISLILVINTLIGFIGSLIINARLTKLCNVCSTVESNYYTYQLNQFISVIKLLCFNYVFWSIISICVVAFTLRGSKFKISFIDRIKNRIKKIKVSNRSKVRKK